ncbi:mRNA N(6)-methyladenine demethylase [Sarracenia purpurea var. burkii]
MTGELSDEVQEYGAGDGFMNLLKNLGREEILEVLSEVEGFCPHCESILQARIRKLVQKKSSELLESSDDNRSSIELWSTNSSSLSSSVSSKATSKSTSWSSIRTPEFVYSGPHKVFASSSPASVNGKRQSFPNLAFEISLNGGLGGVSSLGLNGLSEEQKRIRFAQISRKKDFSHIERIDGRARNVPQGLELHTQVFNAEEQKEIVDCVYSLPRMGHNGQLRARTYSEPKKWMRGKGRVTIQFGCCYNYAVDKNGNPPGIVRDEKVDPLPLLFKQMINRMVRWHVLPPTCIPNSCIVNIYEEGDCIPPHIDHHDFLRPFCTVSFLTECKILFGANLKVISAGEFAGPISIPLPVGSVFILSGNGADIAKHCIPGVPAKRISITFRKMDDSKQPYSYSSDPDLMGIKPILQSPITKPSGYQKLPENNNMTLPKPVVVDVEGQKLPENNNFTLRQPVGVDVEGGNNSIFNKKDDFPPLGNLSLANRPRRNRNGSRQ